MPSGPKKRKAAKKKKESNLNPSSHAYGDDDLERPESKECHNGGEAPSQEHHSNLDQLTEDEKEENGNVLGENPVVGGLHSNENNGEKLGKEEVGNSSVESEVDIEVTIIKENGRSGHEELSRDIDKEDQCDGVISVEGKFKIGDAENGISEHEEIARDTDEVGHCDEVIPVERQTKIEDTGNKEIKGSGHEETGRDVDAEDQYTGVNGSASGGLAEEDASLVDPVNAGVQIVPTEGDANNEDEPNKDKGRSEHDLYDTKDAQLEEQFAPIDSVNGEVREAPNDKENDTSHPEKNCTLLLLEHMIEEIGKRKAIVMDEKVDVFSVTDAALLPEEMVLKHVDTTSATDSKDLIVDGQLIHSKNIPITPADNEAKLHGATPYEPSLVAAPGPLQKTSWKGCCGLFELFTRSG